MWIIPNQILKLNTREITAAININHALFTHQSTSLVKPCASDDKALECAEHHWREFDTFSSSMDHTDCSGWYEGAEFANYQSRISTKQLQGFASSWPSWDGTAATSNSKSHSEAEKRRRDRINEQLQTLRKLIPKSEKMDKAALLASVIDNVKDLKGKATEVSKAFTVPSDVDEVRISTYVPQEDASGSCQANIFIQATMCCEDRPELLAELGEAIHSQKLLIIRAEMACLGCRVQIELLLSSNGLSDNDGSNAQTGEGLNNLKRTLRSALNRVVNSTQSVTSYRVASKRQRFFFPKAAD